MGNFIESFTKVQKNKISLFAHMHVLASSSINFISCVSQDLFFSETMLHFATYVQFSEVLNQARSNNMLQNFAQDTSQ